MSENWIARWEQGRTGWHEPHGNAALKRHWPDLPGGARVLVPLCGKTCDLVWLEAQGLSVVGAELSTLAVEAFFRENHLGYTTAPHGASTQYQCTQRNISIFCGDYFSLSCEPCDALYDRGSLVALPPELRARYVRHTSNLLAPDGFQMVITLEYDQSRVDGPPWSVSAAEIQSFWPDLVQVSSLDDLDNCPPKFREAGLDEIHEVVWMSRQDQGPLPR